jgi:N-formylglutamate deformylase
MHPVLKLIQSRDNRSLAESLDENSMIKTHAGVSALVLDSPHSGTTYPEDFSHACDLMTLRRAEDTHVEKLYSFSREVGAAWVEALFPRSYLDANRGLTEIDPELLDAEWPYPTDPASTNVKVRLGKSLIWRLTDEGEPIYARLLTVSEVQQRIDTCWKPYHQALTTAINKALSNHGYCIHINCHSMPAIASSHATEFPGLVHSDFVIGDRDGTTAAPHLSQRICEHLRDQGYTVSYNYPYKGVEIVKKYGRPAEHCHSIQIEINRKLYMCETSLEIKPEFYDIKNTLRSLIEMLGTINARV